MKIKFIAHRGYSGLATENTMPAFKHALKADFFGIELDIHLTKDKRIVVHHDNDTRRLGNINLEIKNSMYEEIKKVKLLDTNNKDKYIHEIIELRKVLELVQDKKMLYIEIKPLLDLIDLNIIIEEIKNYKNITLISFHISNLINLRTIDEEIKLEYLTSKFDIEVFKICKLNNINLDLNYKLINRESMKYFNEAGFNINTWTVNNKEDVYELSKLGIKYITSDKIDSIILKTK